MIRHLLTLTVALSFVSSLASAALSPSDKQSIPYENRAASVNSGFENGISKWASSPAITLADSTPQAGSKYAQWNSTSAAQTLTLGSIGRPEGQLEVSCAVRVPSGAATHTFSVVESSGSTTVASMSIENSTTWRYQTLIFPSPSAGTLSIVFTSVAADEPSIDIDDCYVGRARNVGSTQLIIETTAWSPNAVALSSGSITNATSTGKYSRNGDRAQISTMTVFSSASAAFSGFRMSLPPGCKLDTNKIVNDASFSKNLNSTVTMLDSGVSHYGIAGKVKPISGDVDNVEVVWSTTNYAQAAITNTSPFTFAGGDSISLDFEVPCQGWFAQTTASIDAISKRGSIYFASGSATNTGAVATFNVAGFGTNTLEGQALAPTTANDLGIRMTGAPAATYEIQATGLFYASSAATTGTRTVCQYSLYDGTNSQGNAYAIAAGGLAVESNDGIGSLTGQFVLSSAGTINVVVRGQRVTGNGTCYAEGPINISIKNVSQNSPAIVLAGSRNALRTGRTSTQSIADSTFVVVLFNSNTTSDDGWYDSGTGRYTFLKNGCYFVAPVVAFSGSSAGSTRALEIRKNGTRTAFIAPRAGSLSGSATSVVGQDLVCGSSGDYIDVTAYQDTGGALNTVAGIDSTYLTIFRVAGGPN